MLGRVHVSVFARICMSVIVHAWVFACVFSLCVQHSLNPIQQKVFVYLRFPSIVARSHTNPYLRTYSGLLFGVRLQLDSKAWQEGRKPLTLLLACH